ncbi:MAG TPA: EVE domain-containing protein [Usitatibacteraceae bacterium]|nr:EVE domain-containing protein [Usitatibacteraceae bacterium]
MSYWLMKSEPAEFSIDDLARAPGKSTPWFGVRNYQSRNYMRDAMRVGDGVLFYHSSCEVPGIAGLARVSSAPHPDETQFDRKSPYFDPKAARDNPRWILVDVELVKKTRLLSLEELRGYAELADMVVLRRGNRLSITPVTPGEWAIVTKILARDAR